MSHRIVNVMVVLLLSLMIPAWALRSVPQPLEATVASRVSSNLPEAQTPGPQTPNGFVVSKPTWPVDTTGLPPAPPPQAPKGESIVVPNLPLPKAQRDFAPPVSDPVLQFRPGAINMPDPIQNWDGISNTGVQPPDTDGQVGPDHYVQIVNAAGSGSQIRVWDKAGTQLYDFGLSGLWPPGDRCNQYSFGDPVVLYDQLADRWLLTQFTNPPSGPYNECVAVSKTGTPTNTPGDWWLYTFNVHPTNFNDYPKIGVWPDGYYMMAHQFANGSAWAGTGVWVFDRAKMLNGQAATFQYKDLYPVNPNYGGMLPSNLMGSTLPPAGSPNYYVEVDQDWSGADDIMTVFAFHVDWTNPANTSFTVAGELVVAPFDADLCPAAREQCIDQPGRPQSLEAISDRLMMHAWYRNLGDHEALVFNHTVDADGAGHAGIRWYELRKTNPTPTTWSIYQQGTFAPTTDHRWMGSLAMDHMGNIALGYSVSSSSVYPSVRYAGRLTTDPLGTLSQSEATLVAGGGSFYSYRWGDYSAMSVDPVDDCTFWYTQEYVKAGETTWSTRVGSWKFPNCLIGPQGILTGVVTHSSNGDPISGATIQATTSLTQSSSTQSGSDGRYLVSLPIGVYTVTASAYGFLPKTSTGVTITQSATTTLNIALDLSPVYVVSGTVRDALTSWPLYAQITISAYPGAPVWTDPATGFYSVTLVAGAIYNFNVTSFSPGYLPTDQSVGPLTGNTTLNIGLNTDLEICTAPGYELYVTGIYQPFDATTTPPGWNVTSSGVCPWGFDDPGGRGNLTGGSGNFAIADSDACGITSTMSTTLYSPIVDVSSLAWLTLTFNYDYNNLSSFEVAAVDVSANGGATWTSLFTWNTDQRGPALFSQDVTSLLGGSTEAQIRFRYVAPGWDWWWQVDNVFMGRKVCQPESGGLVVGNVSDVNTSLALNGATVSNQGGYSTNTVATLADPTVGDGFYVLFSPTGTQVFTATKLSYKTETVTVTVPLSSTVRQDFALGAGKLGYTPSAFDILLPVGTLTTLPMTLTNSGGLAAAFEIQENDGGSVPLMPPARRPPYKPRVRPYWDPSETMTSQPTKTLLSPPAPGAWGIGAPIPTGSRYRAAGVSCEGKTYYIFGGQNNGNTVLNETWRYDPSANMWTRKADMPVALMSMEATCVDGYIYLVGGYTGSAHTNNFQVYNTATDTWVASMWPNIRTPMTAAWNGKLYAVGGSPGPSAETWMYDPATASWAGPLAPMPMATTYGGATAMADAIYVVGGAATGAAQRYDPAADTWSTGPALPAARMNPMLVWYGDRLYAASGGYISGLDWIAYSDTLMLDTSAWPGGSWTPQGETVLTPVVAAAYDCVNNRIYGAGGTNGGNYYAINQYLDDGQTCHLSATDVPWLSESPISGTVALLSSQVIGLILDATGTDPGIYKAGLRFKNDTPYLVPNLPVTLTVIGPDIALVKTGPALAVGDTLVYEIAYSNIGIAAASAVTIVDTLPAGVTYVASSPGGTYNPTAGTMTWNVGAVMVGVTQTVVLTANKNSALPVGTLLTNTVTVSATPSDIITANNTSRVTTVVGPSPSLDSSTKTVDKAIAHQGDVVTFTITLVNSGNVTATVTVTDPIPVGLVYVLDSSSLNEKPTSLYDSVANHIGWHGTISVGGTVTIRFRATVTATAGTTIANIASVDNGLNRVLTRRADTQVVCRIFLPWVIK